MRKFYLGLVPVFLVISFSFFLVSWTAGNPLDSGGTPGAAGNSQPPGHENGQEDHSPGDEHTYSNVPPLTDQDLARTSGEEATAGNNPGGENVSSTAETTTVTRSLPETPVRVIRSLPVKERVVFITIDDGWFPSAPLLQLMRQEHLPVTAFLTQKAAQKYPDYWKDFIAAGGSIENHTFSHPNLTGLEPTALKEQINKPMAYYRSLGASPFLFRPPYGAYNQSVCQAVYSAGISDLVLWNAVMEDGALKTYKKGRLEPGSIILMHWTPDLANQLTRLLTILRQQNLGVADLATAIKDPSQIKAAWPQTSPPPGPGTSTASQGGVIPPKVTPTPGQG